MTTSLTVHYTVSVFVLLTAASAFLYWGLTNSMSQQNRDSLRQKMQVLTAILKKEPLDRLGVEQEVQEEAEILGPSQSPFFLRVLDNHDRLVVESPAMASLLPVGVFPPAQGKEPRAYPWRSAGRLSFLLASANESGAPPASPTWHIQAALNVSAQEQLLASYRRAIVLVLMGGLVISAIIGSWIARRGLRPLADITRATERIGAQQLQERIKTGSWPQELAALATAFDHMLDRLQEAFERLSQFSADLAHELRTPINNLMGEAQVALSRSGSAAEYARVLQSALEEHARLARMIDSMLFLAQADQSAAVLKPIPLDVQAELQAVADFYQALADEQNVELVREGDGRVFADPLLLRRALSNLLSNALKYTSSGGRVTIQAAASGNALVVSVIDTGVGIDAHHLPKLGNRFYRVDPSRTGSANGAGLGLAIVKSIMTLHAGSLSIASTAGIGTKASLVFPTNPPLAGAPG
jgi:two-component system, OmpR family, heavy metal sensor histidine kinase CusS